MLKQECCPDCGTGIGLPHKLECDVERCSTCRSQRVSCDCKSYDSKTSRWTGEWPYSANEKKQTSEPPATTTLRRIYLRPFVLGIIEEGPNGTSKVKAMFREQRLLRPILGISKPFAAHFLSEQRILLFVLRTQLCHFGVLCRSICFVMK